MMIKIAPSILSADFGKLAAEVMCAENGGADMIHIDVMDGHFVPNLTIGPGVVRALRPHAQLPFDVHLMIEQPERYLQDFVQAGADIISVHVEACPHLHRTIQQIKELGAKAGVALNPATPLTVLEHVLVDIDLVVIMTVNPGFGGQKFIPQMLRKIRQLRQLIDGINPAVEIEVDGGVNSQLAPRLVQVGASILVAGSAVYGQADVAQAIATLRTACQI